MRILVTRPEEAGQRTAARLRTLGHDPVLLPLMIAEHHPDAVLAALRQPHAALAVTSAEAVRVLRSLGPELTPQLGTTVFAVGEATAIAAREAGFSSVQVAEGTGASMVEIFGGQLVRRTSSAPLLYLAGSPRSPVLEAGLAALEVPVLVAETYSMHPLSIDPEAVETALGHPPIDIVLLYSQETARRFFEVVSSEESLEALRRVPLLCLSENVAKAVPERLRQNVHAATRPDEDSLLTLL